MGSRDLTCQRSLKTGAMASVGPIKTQRPVLLPFEKQLAATIGLTEDEYIVFRKEVEKQSRVRPAAYDHIPDIRCDPVSIIVSLAVGVVLTAASALLAPKPKAPDEQKQRQNIRQSDLTGPSRYNTTYGFESLGDIATWSTPVPIIFGKLVEEIGLNTGGIVVTPDLVWSRLLYRYILFGTAQKM